MAEWACRRAVRFDPVQMGVKLYVLCSKAIDNNLLSDLSVDRVPDVWFLKM